MVFGMYGSNNHWGQFKFIEEIGLPLDLMKTVAVIGVFAVNSLTRSSTSGVEGVPNDVVSGQGTVDLSDISAPCCLESADSAIDPPSKRPLNHTARSR